MRICVFGAGSIGGVIAAGLARSGAAVSVVARGAHLQAIRAGGLRVQTGAETATHAVAASDRAGDFGPQDLVIVTVKAHALPGAVPALLPLIGDGTRVIYALNGIPWWYFHGEGGPHDGYRLACLDPEGGLWDRVGAGRTIGCVVNFAADNPEPGLIRRIGANNRLLLGLPDAAGGGDLAAVAEALRAAGFVVETDSPIRNVIWTKLRRGATSAAVATLTLGPAGQALGNADVRRLFRTAMDEITAVAAAHGCTLDDSAEAQIEDLARSPHQPSMLQDLLKGRSMEIDAQLTATQEMAALAGIATPVLDLLAALVRARAQNAGLYPRG